jgi:hypothetical protein
VTANLRETACRHVQGSEAPDFLQLFPKGVVYAPGGVASGLTAVSDEAAKAPQLYRVTGKRTTRISQVPTEASSLTSGAFPGAACIIAGMYRFEAGSIVAGLVLV